MDQGMKEKTEVGAEVECPIGGVLYQGVVKAVQRGEGNKDVTEPVDEDTAVLRVAFKGLFGADFEQDVLAKKARVPLCKPAFRNLDPASFKPASPQDVIEALRALSAERMDLERELNVRLAALTTTYEHKWGPLDEKKSKIVSKHGKLLQEPFWLRVLRNSELRELVEEHDLDVLTHLMDVKASFLDPSGETGFKLEFTFEENEFFENKVITKTYFTEKDNDFSDDTTVTKIEADCIDWKPGKDVTVETEEKKRKGGGAKKKSKTVVKPRPSFFRHFFRTIDPEKGFDLSGLCLDDDEELPEDTEEIVSMLMQDDYEKGSMLREHIIPHAIRWYTGEAGDESDGDEDSDDDDEDDDSDSDDQPRARGGHGHSHGGKACHGHGGAAAGGESKAGGKKDEECKQQ